MKKPSISLGDFSRCYRRNLAFFLFNELKKKKTNIPDDSFHQNCFGTLDSNSAIGSTGCSQISDLILILLRTITTPARILSARHASFRVRTASENDF